VAERARVRRPWLSAHRQERTWRRGKTIAWDRDRWKLRFFAIWGGQALSLLGSRLVQFALVWWLAKTTGSATALALAGMMAYVPIVFLGPLAGALVDRWSRRLVMLFADTSVALATGVLAILFATGSVHVPLVYGLMFIRAVGSAFHWPAMQAATTLMVPKPSLTRVAGLNQTLHGLGLVLSPPLGALLLELLYVQGVLVIDMATWAIAVAPLLFIRIPEPSETADGAAATSVLIGLREGLAFIVRWRGVVLLVGALALMNFIVNPAFVLLPLYVVRILDGAAMRLGALQAVFGIGFVIGGLLLSAWGGFRRRIVTALLAIALMGAGIVVMGVAPHGWLYLVGGALFVVGVMEPIATGSIVGTLQASIPEAMQGRVFSLLGSATQAVVPLGLALAGPLSDRFGIRLWFVIGGIAYLFVGLGSFLSPSILQIETDGERIRSETEARSIIETVLDE
jgi:DHA3 family macrolide efflux protein-like MFS transporter